MSRTKTIISIILVLSMSFLFAGCSQGKGSSNSSSETNNTSTSTENNSETPPTTVTTGSWPENANTANVPAPSFGDNAEQISVIDSGGITALTYIGVNNDEAESYLQELKDAGFTSVEADSNIAGTHSYTARNVDTGTHLSFSYTSTSKTLTVSLDRIGV